MPHKRAKRSVREQQKGLPDRPPTSESNESVPKSIARILDAAKIRSKWKETVGKRKREEGIEPTEQPRSKKKRHLVNDTTKTLLIQPGESLSHFNRRVEDDMRSSVKTAMQSSSILVRRAKKMGNRPPEKAKLHSSAKTEIPTPYETNETKKSISMGSQLTDFVKASTSIPRRLNDIVQAPPQIRNVPRGAARAEKNREEAGEGIESGVVSMAQKIMMEAERENAIRRYRELKGRRIKQKSIHISAVD